MKFFKKTACAFLALSFCFGACALTACGGGNEADGYHFRLVFADGSAATDYSVQLCSILEDGSLGVCYAPVKADENGYVVYNASTCKIATFTAGEYEIHILPDAEFEGEKTTPVSYSTDVITLTISL